MYTLATFLALASYAAAGADWHYLSWYTPSGEEFTGMSGELVVPSMPSSGTTYVWPGLQPTDNSGVYQNVLQNGGDPFFGSGWCCSNPSLPWGGGFNSNVGSTVTFQNVQDNSANWTSTVTQQGNSGDDATTTFPLGDKSFNDFVLAIEQYDATWNFGPVYWKNIYVTSTGTDNSWCTDTPSNYNNAVDYTITGLSSTVSGNTVKCYMESVTFNSPVGYS